MVFLIPMLFVLAIGEELGWRGFALPRLMDGRSALSASLILGVLWAIFLAALAAGTDAGCGGHLDIDAHADDYRPVDFVYLDLSTREAVCC
jgi:membrane protease YdiL (CAAX protease family)